MKQFYSNNNRELLSKIHKKNCFLSDVEDFNDDQVIMEYVIEKKQQNDFHFDIGLGNSSCTTLVCKICNNDKLIVGQSAFFTAVRCDYCNYEVAAHEG